jgi:hypothetical protein
MFTVLLMYFLCSFNYYIRYCAVITIHLLAYAKISQNDKKTIIWSFMEELWENYLNALENNLPPKFEFMNFLTLQCYVMALLKMIKLMY